MPQQPLADVNTPISITLEGVKIDKEDKSV